MNFCAKSIISIFISLLIILLLPQTIRGQLKNYLNSDLCQVDCGPRVHTLCDTLTPPDCDKYEKINIFEAQTLSNGKLVELLVNGHNGLRDRIAYKANIANMVKLTWDEDLAKMAIKYFKQCSPEVEDPCTLFESEDITNQDKIEYRESNENNHRFIAQNLFSVKADFFPKNFIESALRSWYNERTKTSPASFMNFRRAEYHIGYIPDENNFTHLACPLVANFGCSIAQIDKNYKLVCNYYPYYRTVERFMVFLSALPTSACPSFFPLKDESFVNLCYNGLEMDTDSADRTLPQLSRYMLIVVAGFLQIWI